MATEIQKPVKSETPEDLLDKTLEKTLPSNPLGTEESTKKVEDLKDSGHSTTEAPTAGFSASNSVPVTTLQKKIRRAERFGMPVQLSEEEKRNSRAERFGTVPGSGALKKSEEQKRKARAERFGLRVEPVVDDEVKKQARLARFASVSKKSSVDEDKRKAREIRFSQARSAASQVNVEASSGKETSNVGKATGVA